MERAAVGTRGGSPLGHSALGLDYHLPSVGSLGIPWPEHGGSHGSKGPPAGKARGWDDSRAQGGHAQAQPAWWCREGESPVLVSTGSAGPAGQSSLSPEDEL